MACFGIFLDLSKAFDTVSIPILLRKMEAAGIRGNALKIFEDFLTDREQCVQIGQVTSRGEKICYGVPQGSIISPSLFLLYVNDLCKLKLQNCETYMYADDTVLLAYGTDWKTAKENAEVALKAVMAWLSANLLTLNLSKTKAVAFHINPRSSPPPGESVIKAHVCPDPGHPCNCLPLILVTNTKYLGVCVDEKLNWHSHLESLKTRVRRLLYIFKSLRESADHSTLRNVYLALCQSILSYCVPVWGGTHKTAMLGIERAQRAVLKVMMRKPRRFPTSALFSECSVLSVRKLFILRTILRKHGSTPYDRNVTLRSGKPVCRTEQTKTSFAQRQFSFLASNLYNKLNKLLSIHSINNFEVKNRITNYLLHLSYDETENLLVRIS